MRHLILPSLFLLAACSHAEPGIEIRTVEVPVPVSCVTAAQIPAVPEKVGHLLTGNAVHDLSVVAESALELRKYAGELRALLVGCD